MTEVVGTEVIHFLITLRICSWIITNESFLSIDTKLEEEKVDEKEVTKIAMEVAVAKRVAEIVSKRDKKKTF